MSYCRFAWDGSDVYVYGGEEGLVCCGCRLAATDAEWFTSEDPAAMIQHLADHKKAGDFVPLYAVERLWQEIEGPNEPVRPEPESMRRAKELLRGGGEGG